ncbi:hypothetical protein PR048_001988 [Dryococelus australis]|uniref:Integrase zinc-binding domain-containing protein n=1 Tax=Dryococelus australis TaxID=614101 RepID=A0ABQ9IIV8_9NEOP|nr:hypothetical protein PR048_001988 [Dryococelus australis]
MGNQALTWLYSHPKQVGKIGRWIASLNNFRFKVIYIKGKDNAIVEAGGHTGIVLCYGQDNAIGLTDFQVWQRENKECQELKEKIEHGFFHSMGRTKIKAVIKRKFYWPNMNIIILYVSFSEAGHQ